MSQDSETKLTSAPQSAVTPLLAVTSPTAVTPTTAVTPVTGVTPAGTPDTQRSPQPTAALPAHGPEQADNTILIDDPRILESVRSAYTMVQDAGPDKIRLPFMHCRVRHAQDNVLN